MNSRQLDELSMLNTTKEFLDNQKTVLTNIPLAAPAVELFLKDHVVLSKLFYEQEVARQNTTNEKNKLRSAILEKAKDLKNKITAIAESKSDDRLKNAVAFTDTTLERSSDLLLNTRVEIIITEAKGIVSDLAIYGTTLEELDTFTAQLVTFSKATPQPKITKNDGKIATNELQVYFQKCKNDLKSIDNIIKAVQGKEPKFFAAYFAARKIQSTARGSIALRARATDLQGNPISNVTFQILNDKGLMGLAMAQTTKSDKPLVIKKTTVKGNFQMKNFPDGEYIFVAHKLGFLEKRVPFKVINGESTHVNVVLEPKE